MCSADDGVEVASVEWAMEVKKFKFINNSWIESNGNWLESIFLILFQLRFDDFPFMMPKYIIQKLPRLLLVHPPSFAVSIARLVTTIIVIVIIVPFRRQIASVNIFNEQQQLHLINNHTRHTVVVVLLLFIYDFFASLSFFLSFFLSPQLRYIEVVIAAKVVVSHNNLIFIARHCVFTNHVWNHRWICDGMRNNKKNMCNIKKKIWHVWWSFRKKICHASKHFLLQSHSSSLQISYYSNRCWCWKKENEERNYCNFNSFSSFSCHLRSHLLI